MKIKEEIKKNSSNNKENTFLYLIYFYFKQLLNTKNLILFCIMFFLLWTLYDNLNSIIKYSAKDDVRLITKEWRLKIDIMGIYFTFVTIYSYIYLRKNNFSQINKNENIVINIIIIFILFLLTWGITFAIMFHQIYPYKDLYDSYDYKVLIYMFIIMFFYNLASFFILNFLLINFKKLKQKPNFLYVFLILLIVIQVILFFWIQNFISLPADETLNKLYNLSFAFILITVIFFILDVIERLIFNQINKQEKNKKIIYKYKKNI